MTADKWQYTSKGSVQGISRRSNSEVVGDISPFIHLNYVLSISILSEVILNMSRTLYNEGRVVGLSAYEIYVKQHASEDPVNPPASEREWLASTIAMGSSMLVKIPQNISHGDSENWVLDIQFPSDTLLCAANTIIGSFFRGNGVFENDSNWASRVSSYGDLISNKSSSSPSGNLNHSSNIPYDSIETWSDEDKKKLANYMNIIDGVIIQPGNWVDSTVKPPQKDLSPNMGDYPRLRLQIRGKINTDIQILLTGFTIRTVVKGLTGLDGSTDTSNPQDGDFLGPGQFPWASKIIFSVPTSYVSYFNSSAYIRKLPVTGSSESVKDSPVIDMKTTAPETYYESNHKTARVPVYVDDFTTLGDGTAVLTVYQKSEKYPPAIWGTFVDSKGDNYLNPLDVVAPGTVKMFEDATSEEIKDYEDTFDGSFGMNRDSDTGTISTVDKNGDLVPAAKVSVQDINYKSSATKAKMLVTETGNLKGLSVSLSSGLSGSQYTIGDDTGNSKSIGNTSFDSGKLTKISPNTSNVTWSHIFEALANNKSIDILGDNMKALKAGLNSSTYPYIQLSNGLRLYISATEPTPSSDIPIGSIGIGWTEE